MSTSGIVASRWLPVGIRVVGDFSVLLGDGALIERPAAGARGLRGKLSSLGVLTVGDLLL